MAVRASDGSRVIHFGVFEADLRAGELRRNGSKVKLQEQPFQILAMLLERPGEIVTREELRARLWSADTFVDFDHGLNSAIRRLRDALAILLKTPVSWRRWGVAATVLSARWVSMIHRPCSGSRAAQRFNLLWYFHWKTFPRIPRRNISLTG